MARLWLLVAVLLPVCAEQPETLLKQALEAHQSGDVDTAIKFYKEFLKLRPASVEARSNLGAALARKGRYEEAIGEYQAALKLAPSNPGVSLNLALAYYKTGEIRHAAGELTALQALT